MNAHKKELTDFMVQEGVILPASPVAGVCSNAVPPGAKFTDNELVNTIKL